MTWLSHAKELGSRLPSRTGADRPVVSTEIAKQEIVKALVQKQR